MIKVGGKKDKNEDSVGHIDALTSSMMLVSLGTDWFLGANSRRIGHCFTCYGRENNNGGHHRELEKITYKVPLPKRHYL